MNIQERYSPIVFGEDETKILQGTGIGGFICQATGAISITRESDATSILTDFPVTAGEVYSLPIFLGTVGYTVTLSGGAAGTLLTQ